MNINSRLFSKLAEVGSSNNIDYSYGGSPTNSYPNVGFNNYNGNLEPLQNNLGADGMINMYNSDPLSISQARRFNEIVPHLIEGTDYLTQKANQNYTNFANELSNTFSGNSRVRNMPHLQSRANISQLMPSNNLNVDANIGDIDDPTSVVKQEKRRETYIPMPSQSVDDNVFNNYRYERDYRTGFLGNEKNRKNLTIAVIAIIIGGFMLFMLIQLYMNQKKLEYMLEVYRVDPVHSPYYVIQNQQDEYNGY